MNLADVRALAINFNPYRKPFNFIEIDEWLDWMRTATEDHFPAVEGVTNMHRMTAQHRDASAPQLSFKTIDKWRFLIYANPGANEGDYVHFDAELRRSNPRQPAVTISLLSAKTFGGLDHAIDVSAFWTRALFVQ